MSVQTVERAQTGHRKGTEWAQKGHSKGPKRIGHWFGDGSVEIGKIGDTRLSLVSSNGQNVREFDKGQTAIPISA